jgi:TPR repeat protein
VWWLLAGVGLVVGLGCGAGDAAPLPSALAAAEQRLAPRFASRGVAYPPRAVALLALKREARLELWADGGSGWTFVRSYLIRAASGSLGPKLREGDHQVPEGVYRIAALHPASAYHLSLEIDYPNAFDRARAAEDGRTRLGGSIMIHGGSASDGCLPLGDAGVEEVFALVERVGTDRVDVVVSPLDLRRYGPRLAAVGAGVRPSWVEGLYETIARALEPFGLPADDGPAAGRAAAPSTPRCRGYDVADCVRRCERGDRASCARAGLMYEGGRGVAADADRAWSLLRRACEGGDAFGCAELGRLYLADDGPRLNAARALELAEAACAGGDGHGCSDLAQLCTDGVVYAPPGACAAERVRGLREAAVARLRRGCAGWDAYDCTTLAAIYYPGDRPTSLRFAAGACDGGDAAGCWTAARVAEDAGDAAGAAASYARACERGWLAACERARGGVVHAVALP